MKIYELAKELGVESKKIIAFLQSKGVDAKSHMSNVPENLVNEIKNKFSKNGAAQTAPSTGGIKAVALPEKIVKQMEEEAKAKAAKDNENSSKDEENAAERKTASDEPKKKKKIVGVFNPQYSQTGNDKGQNKNKDQKKEQGQKKDNKTPKPLPSQIRPARDRKPDDYVSETKEIEKSSDVKTTPESVSSAETAAKTEIKPAKSAESVKQENTAAAAEKKNNAATAAQKNAANTSENRTSKESEAIQSLRAKIVKGTINPEDFLITSPKSNNKRSDRNDGQRQNGQRQNNRNNNNNNNNRNSNNNNGRNGNNRFNNNQGNGNNNSFNKDRNNDRQDQRQGSRNQDNNRGQRPQDGGGAAAAAPAQPAGRGKKQATKPSKGKYEKNKGDKFDRLENERGAQRSVKAQVKEEPEEEIKVITLPDAISVKDFAAKLKMQPAALIKKLFLQGKVLTLNDILDFETAEEIALEMDIISEKEVQIDYIEELLKEEPDPEETLKKRPPVVCIMGHVDHGKTSLLDAIRQTNVTSREAGGITQHIGAYTVEINGESITFLDTPGHEAFTSMRLRGAQSTDVAILVVAADDGVMPQTIEAINHAKAANIHVIVAVNKIDKPAANIERVKQELSEHGLVPEDWGGDTIFVPVSAKTGEGIESLLEMVILDTEILDLKANPDRMARGVVIEARLDKGRGSVATLLVQKGTLKIGDHVAMGESYGKVRVMTNDKGKRIKTATPSTPVEITGLNGVPSAGEVFVAFNNDKDAKNFSHVYEEENKKKLIAGSKTKMSLDDVFDQIKAGELKELNLIIKADVQGSVEALKESLEKLSNNEVVVKVIHSGAGNVSESDAILASASNAIIIAFNVDANPAARSTIEHEKVDMRKYSVIYNAIDDVEAAMKGMLDPIKEEVITGHAEIRQTFKASGIGLIAGTYITDGIIRNTSSVRLTRGEEQLYDGPIASLKRFSDDAKEVRSGFECGIVLKDFQDIKEGDTMTVYEMKVVPRA